MNENNVSEILFRAKFLDLVQCFATLMVIGIFLNFLFAFMGQIALAKVLTEVPIQRKPFVTAVVILKYIPIIGAFPWWTLLLHREARLLGLK
ncbi:MAG: hypothetical protein RI911_542 [Candidatus Parcubacteria bacterium]|jgi:hypothetical protein